MTEFRTLQEVLIARRESRRAVHYIESERAERSVELRGLHSRAVGLLRHFQDHGADAGSEMILLVDSNEQFIDAFWACVAGAIVAVPIAPGINDEQRAKFFRVLRQLKRPSLCSDTKTHARLSAFAAANGLRQELERVNGRITLLDHVDDVSRAGKEHSVSPDDIAFLQYSSGSTGEPKGVMLTHRNVTANVAAIIAGAEINANDSTLSWMPLTHDMGLIGFHLVPLAADLDQYLMPTSLFVRRPQLWLAKASEKRATLLCSPNFGYRHLLRSYKAANAAELDLSATRVLFNGAEPISVELCDDFLQAMAAHRLSKTSMFPVYGLAEASLAVSFPKPGISYQKVAVDRRSLNVGARVKPLHADQAQAVTLACVGEAVAGCAFSICNDDGGALEKGHVGHIRIRGENVTRGYYAEPEATSNVISADGWLDTGDLGFVSASGLVVTGRRKDILFVAGQNHYPQDLEALLDRYAGIELGKAAVAAARPYREEADKVLVFVLFRGELDDFMLTVRQVRKCINEQCGVAVDHVLPTPRIPKTTSGKIQRYLLAQDFESGGFDEVIAELTKREDANDSSIGTLTGIERTLKEICDAFLTDRPLRVNDNIFELGTSSLTLAQIYERIEAVYPGQIEVTDFFDYPTIAELAKYLERRLAAQT